MAVFNNQIKISWKCNNLLSQAGLDLIWRIYKMLWVILRKQWRICAKIKLQEYLSHYYL